MPRARGTVIHRPLNRLVRLNDSNSVGKPFQPRRRAHIRRLLLHLSGVFVKEAVRGHATRPVAYVNPSQIYVP